MRLREALQVRRGEVIALVGAGGKTTAMYRLARELADEGWRVITTTTTMIRPPSAEQSESWIVEPALVKALDLTRRALQRQRRVTLATAYRASEDKLQGVDCSWIAELIQLADAVIVEADGARGRSLKAPAPYEPVVPENTTLLVPVAAVDAVGQPLDDNAVHRPESVAQVTGLPMGDTIKADTLAQLFTHERGALKSVPAQCRVMPLLNKVGNAMELATARNIALAIHGHSALDRVLLATVMSANPVVECWRRVSAIVLAAGGARRFGAPKLLVPVAGRTLIEHTVLAAQASCAQEVIVVLGHGAPEIAGLLPEGCRAVLNKDWGEGISSSLHAGLAAMDHRSEAALFIQADQPYLSGAALDDILHAYYGSTKAMIVPVHQGRRGTPIVFDRRVFPQLDALRGDVGGRELLTRLPGDVETVPMPSAELFLDIDTPADYEQYLERTGGEPGRHHS